MQMKSIVSPRIFAHVFFFVFLFDIENESCNLKNILR